MKSLTGKFLSARGWAVMLILLFGAGLFVAACGDEEVPSPTTPAPPPPTPTPTPPPAPEPEPAPEPPAVPVGLRISASGMDFIEWSWNAVEGVSGYDVQYSANEAFTAEDETIARTAEEISYRREGLEAGASAFLRVRAAAGMGEERVTSDWSTHVTGMTAEPEPEVPPAPAAPANLRLKESGSDFIEWVWDEVSGADGYESQFSTDGTSFGHQQSHAGASSTSRKVPNLAAETAGHLRVRSYTGSGTGADTVRGDWSASDQQTTDKPPAAVALDAPDNFESSDPDDNSIVLEWDEVDDADFYEVQQREDGASSWSDASCGDGGDNEVDDTECIASGLDEGTDYEFRVRGIPADDDDANTTGGWAETDGTTTGRQQIVTPGGMGDLNLTWTADDDSIDWSWEPMSSVTYEWISLPDYNDDADPCADVDWEAPTGSGAHFEAETAATAGEIKGLCLRTDDKDNRALSFAWGIARPMGARAAQGEATVSDTNVTTALTWETLAVTAPFEYEIRAVADPQRDNDIDGTDTLPPKIQAACNDGNLVDQGDTDVSFTLDEVTVSRGLTPYTGYLLCFRLANTAGATQWAVPASNAELYTTPARPPTPTIDGSRTEVTTGNESVVWRLGVRSQATVPRSARMPNNGPANYKAWRVHYNETYRVQDATRNTSTPTPRVANCATQETDPVMDVSEAVWTWTEINVDAMSTDNYGVGVASGNISRNSAPADPDLTGDTRAHVCVQATGAGGDGPWVISSSYEVKRQPASN